MLSGVDPDIVFSDLRMPGKSGIAIYRELLAETARPLPAASCSSPAMDRRARRDRRPRPASRRPQILEKPFSTLDVRGVLGAINDQVRAREVVAGDGPASRAFPRALQICRQNQKPPAGRKSAGGFWLRWTVSVQKGLGRPGKI